MLLSAVEFVDILLQKRRSVIAGVVFIVCFLFISILSPILQAHQANIEAHLRIATANRATQGVYDSPNAITNALSQMADDASGATNSIEINTIKGTMAVASGVTRLDIDIGREAYATTMFTLHTISASVTFTIRGIGDGFAFAGHAIGDIFGLFSGVTNVGSLIHPSDHTPTPVITRMRAQQAAMIQSGTKNVAILMSDGTGGACDNGNGNGSYPLGWCNAPMDSIATISYSSDPINRECTSYAYWYFTAVEGHTDFKAWGNAKYWASSSNYPIHATPVVGGIAVETAGAYGHLAIVQALPGQKFAGQVVPAGYVLVSEMNYDWQGHFRYSYSPLGKFSAYIYP